MSELQSLTPRISVAPMMDWTHTKKLNQILTLIKKTLGVNLE